MVDTLPRTGQIANEPVGEALGGPEAVVSNVVTDEDIARRGLMVRAADWRSHLEASLRGQAMAEVQLAKLATQSPDIPGQLMMFGPELK